jgi:hypothetical protein
MEKISWPPKATLIRLGLTTRKAAMPRRPKRPGFWFWLWTFTLGAFNPEKGKHRVNAKMSELHKAVGHRDSRIRVLESENKALRAARQTDRQELNRSLDRENRLRQALAEAHAEKSRNHESPDDKVDTLNLPVVTT